MAGPALGPDGGDRLTTHHLQTEQATARFEAQLFSRHQLVISARLFRNIGQRGLLGGFQNAPDERGGGGERGRVGPWWFNLECPLIACPSRRSLPQERSTASQDMPKW